VEKFIALIKIEFYFLTLFLLLIARLKDKKERRPGSGFCSTNCTKLVSAGYLAAKIKVHRSFKSFAA
jgi:hypothetical protein